MKATALARVPGSTSNLGSGFDTLGLAVRLYNQVRLTRLRGPARRIVVRTTQGSPQKAAALVQEAASLFFRRTATRPFAIEAEMSGDVPLGRGLGASATARVGVLLALNALAHTGLERADLLDLATELEGHPDNASPALLGGFTVSARIGRHVNCQRFAVSPRVKLVTLIPRFEIDTERARQLVPPTFSKADAAHSLNRAAAITAAFAAKSYEQLRGLCDDRFHQPYRSQLIPQLSAVVRAGERAGAIGGWLSGSGSAIMCLTLDQPEPVARAMQQQLPDSEMRTLLPDNRGAQVVG